MKDKMLQQHIRIFMSRHARLTFHDTVYEVFIEGELYNEEELYKVLRQNHPLKKTTEEIIFYAWKHWGMQAMHHMEGAYSFVIVQDDTVLAVKDPMGLSPLFYASYQNTWYISSSIQTILKESGMPARLTQAGILELFSFGPSLSEDKTLYADIHALPMGSCLQLHNDQASIKAYYELPLREHQDSIEETSLRIKELLTHSILQQKKGCHASFLSGGLDSSIITAVCAASDPTWRTYSLDYEGNEESFSKNLYQVSLDNSFIDLMKKRYPGEHHTLLLKQRVLAEKLEDAMLARDHPGMADVDSSLLWLCEQVKKKDDVILSGECSDELFGGYPWFYREELKDLPSFPWLRSFKQRLSLLHPSIKKLDFQGYADACYQNSLSQIRYLDSDNEDDRRARKHTWLCLHWFMQTLVTRQVCEGKRAGVCIRAPFANVRLLEYVYNIPWHIKFLNQQEKGILRNAFAQDLPKEIQTRKKNPFPKTHNPYYAQLAAERLTACLQDSRSILHALFDEQKLKKLIETKGESYQLPWYGQLMSGPQLMAYLYQIDCWARDYQVELSL